MTDLSGVPILRGMAAVTAAMGEAMSKVGDWYQWDGKGPNTFDCSGLTTDAWAAAGYAIGAGTSGQLATGTFIVGIGANSPWPQIVWELLRGDLYFPGESAGEHVQLYDGEGWIIEAPSTGLKVRRVRQWSTYGYAVRRIVPGDPDAPLLWPGYLLRTGVNHYGTGKWQARLNELLVGLELATDSVYGPKTADATARFQRIRGMAVTGMVDGPTWSRAFAA